MWMHLICSKNIPHIRSRSFSICFSENIGINFLTQISYFTSFICHFFSSPIREQVLIGRTKNATPKGAAFDQSGAQGVQLETFSAGYGAVVGGGFFRRFRSLKVTSVFAALRLIVLIGIWLWNVLCFVHT